ncbi:hypothetical protein [Taibaiella koreensis]|uniref:hypothetical protein n=1 Tax=Taibaiella koreensis TaxID=1268548 RepID=UPI000E59EEC1|nr:hypothetical protein [Taibaiella koreensis]
MDDDRVDIPDFLKAYYEGSDYEGQAKIEISVKHLQQAEQSYRMNTLPLHQAVLNRTPGNAGKKIDPEIALSYIREGYRKEVEATAKEHGYVDPQQTLENKLASEREEFLNKVKAIRQSQNQEETKIEEPQKKMEQPQAARETFMANMDSIKKKNNPKFIP